MCHRTLLSHRQGSNIDFDVGFGGVTMTLKITTCGMWHHVVWCVPKFQANLLFPGWIDVCATALATRRFIVLVDDSVEQSPSWKPTGPKLIKKFPAFYGIQTFITLFTRAILVQSMPPPFAPSHFFNPLMTEKSNRKCINTSSCIIQTLLESGFRAVRTVTQI